MTFVPKTRTRPAGPRACLWALALCTLAACGKGEQPAGPADTTQPPATGATQPAPAPRQAVSDELSAMGADQLRQAASKALAEQRLYAPAGDNAMEYYVALRARLPDDAAVASAITDLMPYVLIATEQSIAREDFAEAQRLYALMEKADPGAPALPRLRQGIADAQAAVARRAAEAEARSEEDARRQAELQRQREAEQQRAQQQAAEQLAAQQQAAPPAEREAPGRPGTDEDDSAPPDAPPATQAPAGEQRTAAQPQPAAPAPPPAPPPAPEPVVSLRPVSTPAPAYPPEALRAGESGEVVVEFTVNPDGSVSNPRVVRATPPRTFDRAALNAVRRWRFQPIPSATTTRRTIGFTPGR